MSYRALVTKPAPCCKHPDGLGTVVEVLNEFPSNNGYCQYCLKPSGWYMAALISGGSVPHRDRLLPLPPESECMDQEEIEIPIPHKENA